MKYLKTLLFIFSLLTMRSGISQQALVSKVELRKAFTEKNEDRGSGAEYSWYTSNQDSLFYKSDTVYLFNSMNFCYHCNGCCNFIEWSFKGSLSFNWVTTELCREPPIGQVEAGVNEVEIQTKNRETVLSVFKDKKLRVKFKILSLEYIPSMGKAMQFAEKYRKLTLLRLRN